MRSKVGHFTCHKLMENGGKKGMISLVVISMKRMTPHCGVF